jgi:hypothetical protein
MIVGFTGTQKGMSDEQWLKVTRLIQHLNPKEVHHGSCIGADAHFHEIVDENYPKVEVHVHPPEDASKRAWVDGDVIHEPKSYLERNQDIVDASEALIATPRGPEMLRSGTWSTVRRARRKRIPIYIVYPSGKVKVEF